MKFPSNKKGFVFTASPPSRWSGLKYFVIHPEAPFPKVSTLAVEWIEMTWY